MPPRSAGTKGGGAAAKTTARGGAKGAAKGTSAPPARPSDALSLSVRMEGGHYTFVEADTDQVGESRLDKNVKKFFVQLHRRVDRGHAMEASY